MEKKITEVEIKYRASKWLISNLANNNLLSAEEAAECIKKLLTHYEPPTRCFEEVPDEKDNKN